VFALALLAGLPVSLSCTENGGPRAPARVESPAPARTGEGKTSPAPSGPASPGEPQILSAIQLEVGGWPVRAEVAHTFAQRQKGLMHRTRLGAEEGMLFAFPSEEYRSFWMQNVSLPLSIAYINWDGEIVDILEMTPYSEASVPSTKPVPLALEMHGGWFAKKGIRVGARVKGLEPVYARPELRPE
jgi:uncharacterized membrane protein (UPF0127 family)